MRRRFLSLGVGELVAAVRRWLRGVRRRATPRLVLDLREAGRAIR